MVGRKVDQLYPDRPVGTDGSCWRFETPSGSRPCAE